jgi:hypothetical protein
MGFEPTIPAFEWAKTVHALDGAATVIGPSCRNRREKKEQTRQNCYAIHAFPNLFALMIWVGQIHFVRIGYKSPLMHIERTLSCTCVRDALPCYWTFWCCLGTWGGCYNSFIVKPSLETLPRYCRQELQHWRTSDVTHTVHLLWIPWAA